MRVDIKFLRTSSVFTLDVGVFGARRRSLSSAIVSTVRPARATRKLRLYVPEPSPSCCLAATSVLLPGAHRHGNLSQRVLAPAVARVFFLAVPACQHNRLCPPSSVTVFDDGPVAVSALGIARARHAPRGLLSPPPSCCARPPPPPPRIARFEQMSPFTRLPWPLVRPAHTFMCVVDPFSDGEAPTRVPWRHALLATSGKAPRTARVRIWQYRIRAPAVSRLAAKLTLHHLTAARNPLPHLATAVVCSQPPLPP